MITGFEPGMRSHRITILNKVLTQERQFGGKTGYKRDGKLYGNYEFVKGAKSAREGALDAYDYVIFRMNYSSNTKITRESLIELYGKFYQITSMNGDYRANKIVIKAMEMTTQVSIVDPEPQPSSSEI